MKLSKEAWGRGATFVWGLFMAVSAQSQTPAPTDASADTGKICVLSFERRNFPLSKALAYVFKGKTNVYYKSEANPEDLAACLLGQYDEVTLVAHALYSDGSSVVNLGYFQELTGADRSAFIEQTGQTLKDQLKKEIQASNEKSDKPVDLECSDKKCLKKIKDGPSRHAAMQILNQLDILADYPADEPLYGYPHPVLPRFFRNLSARAAELRAAGKKLSVRRLRMVNCFPKEIMARYPELKAFLDENQIALDQAEKQNLMSFIDGHDVVAPDVKWILESAQYPDPADKHDKFYVYVKLTTLGLVRFGEDYALRGKYRVKVFGAAVGLDSRWTTLGIKYKDVEDMQVGESRKVTLPHLDLAAGVGLGADLGVDLVPKFKPATELNSAGFSFSFLDRVEVERVY